jgi:AdoMet-dependent heme synthase
MDKRTYVPRLIAWEITRKCHLACRHCRGGATGEDYKGELTTLESFKLLDNIATFNEPIIIILTGGEPMSRPDVYEIAKYGHDLGLRMVMSPCGQLIDDESAEKIKESGIARLSLSIDGATAESHDSFRGVPGAFDSTIKGIEVLKRHGVDFQINTTVTKLNIHELPAILELAIKLGASAFHPFMLVPTGRGSALANLELTPEEYEKTLEWVREKSSEVEIFFKPTCAPHYHRILRQHGGAVKPPHGAGHPRGHAVGHPGGHPSMSNLSRGCTGGISFAFISHVGDVQICGFLPVVCGNVRDNNFDFVDIWDNSTMLNQLRNYTNLTGKCGKCEFVKVCGGCRARAYANEGDYLAAEPYCTWEPGLQKREAEK